MGRLFQPKPGMIEVETAEWGLSSIYEEDLQLLSDFTHLSADECLHRLATYQVRNFAADWERRNPTSPAEIRRFYAETEQYLWELVGWNGSEAYQPYLMRLERLAQLWPPDQYPQALDFGCGVGNAALRLAELGYSVTLADVPGKTLGFARARFEQRGIPVQVIEITKDIPDLPKQQWNVLVSFDVIEHLPNPRQVTQQLIRSVARRGGAAIIASFEAQGDLWPQHLHNGLAELGGERWDLFMSAHGMRLVGDGLFQKLEDPLSILVRKLRYLFWRTTGLYVKRVR